MFLIEKEKAEEGAQKCCFLSLAGELEMSQTFPPPTLHLWEVMSIQSAQVPLFLTEPYGTGRGL